MSNDEERAGIEAENQDQYEGRTLSQFSLA